MQNQLNTLDVTQLHPMLYRDVTVATTEMLAQLYGCETRSLRDNFRNNADRFEEGKHYIQLQGAELRKFISCDDIIDSRFIPSKNARVVNLWTERGAARHAKMLNTDKAWEVFEELEDCYFHAKAQASAVRPGQVEALQAARQANEVITPSSLQTMLDKPMQITVREYLALTQGKLAQPVVEPGMSVHSCGQHYSDEVRAEILDLGDRGWMPAEISERTGVPRDTVSTMLFRARKAGKIAKGPRQGILRRERNAHGGAA